MFFRVNVAEMWLSPFFHWKNGSELSAAADARDDDSSTDVCYKKLNVESSIVPVNNS
jgi:hypothetical protein